MSLCAGGGEVDQRVPVIRRGVDDDLDVLAIEHATEVGDLIGDLGIARELLRDGRGLVGVDVAQRHDVAEPARALDVAPPHPAAADQREPGPIVGAGGAGVCVAAESSRSTNHRGNPVAAAIAVQWLRNVRREMKMRLDIQALNVKRAGEVQV